MYSNLHGMSGNKLSIFEFVCIHLESQRSNCNFETSKVHFTQREQAFFLRNLSLLALLIRDYESFRFNPRGIHLKDGKGTHSRFMRDQIVLSRLLLPFYVINLNMKFIVSNTHALQGVLMSVGVQITRVWILHTCTDVQWYYVAVLYLLIIQ